MNAIVRLYEIKNSIEALENERAELTKSLNWTFPKLYSKYEKKGLAGKGRWSDTAILNETDLKVFSSTCIELECNTWKEGKPMYPNGWLSINKDGKPVITHNNVLATFSKKEIPLSEFGPNTQKFVKEWAKMLSKI